MIAGFLSGLVMIALGLISGYMIFPPVVHEKIIEVNLMVIFAEHFVRLTMIIIR